jgi:hypothetical protein
MILAGIILLLELRLSPLKTKESNTFQPIGNKDVAWGWCKTDSDWS